jgi:hypothetical protein
MPIERSEKHELTLRLADGNSYIRISVEYPLASRMELHVHSHGRMGIGDDDPAILTVFEAEALRDALAEFLDWRNKQWQKEEEEK